VTEHSARGARAGGPFDLTVPRRVHVVAAGGAGMSGIATVLAQQGHRVTGSDLVDSPVLEELRRHGVSVTVGHDPSVLHDAEAVVVSTAVPPDDPEVLEARRNGIPVLSRVELLPSFAAVQPFLSVSGTHGKTTTSSMLAAVLRGSGADPSFLIGARVPVLGAAAGRGEGDWFVLEADESDGSFLAGPRAGAIVTNIEPDHLEFWGGWEHLKAGFARFLSETDGPRLVCADDPVAMEIGRACGAVSYGMAEHADHRIDNLLTGPDGSAFDLVSAGSVHRVTVAVPGVHNALNAAGALAMAIEVGVDAIDATRAMAGYSGVSRRFEVRGDARGVRIVDDYAHLPTEVRAALAAARSGNWRRVVAVFQPHRYSRTQALWQDFAGAFGDADVLVLTEIYPAGEPPRPGVTGRLLVDAVRSASSDARVEWRASLDEVVDFLEGELVEGDLCMSIGAGDVTTLADRLLPRLSPPDGAQH
jgi:UDP-N-acetylmuramate--alanine ligase